MDRVVASTIGLFELAGLYLGDRLGLYRALHDDGDATSAQLAQRTGTDERYVREWLEHQAVSGLISVADERAAATERRYSLPDGHAAALIDRDDAAYIAPLARQALGMLTPLTELSGGVPDRRRHPVPALRGRYPRRHRRPEPRDVHQRARQRLVPIDRQTSTPGSGSHPVPASPISAAAAAGRASRSRGPTRAHSSTASTPTRRRSRWRVPTPTPKGWTIACASSSTTRATTR